MGYAVETKYFKLIVILPRLDLNNTRIYNQKIKALVSPGQILQITEIMTKKFSREETANRVGLGHKELARKFHFCCGCCEITEEATSFFQEK